MARRMKIPDFGEDIDNIDNFIKLLENPFCQKEKPNYQKKDRIDFYKNHKEDFLHDLKRYDIYAKKNLFYKIKNKLYEMRYKDTLMGMYSCKTKEMKYLEDMRYNNGLRCCPFCGILEIGTLDHYLPKEKYPLYSILKNNLVPMCAGCQPKKGMKTPTENKRFLHPYYDSFIDNFEHNIIFNIDKTHHTILFELERDDCLLTTDQKKIVEYHYNKLLNKDKYENHFKTLWESFRGAYLKRDYANITALEDALKTAEKTSRQNSQTYNDWDTIFYRSLIKDTNAVKYLDDLLKIKQDINNGIKVAKDYPDFITNP